MLSFSGRDLVDSLARVKGGSRWVRVSGAVFPGTCILSCQANLLHYASLACSLIQHIRLHRGAALRQAQALLEANLISSIPVAATGAPSSSEKPLEDNAASSYFIVSEAPDPEPGQALNSHFSWYGPARPALQVWWDCSTSTCWRP